MKVTQQTSELSIEQLKLIDVDSLAAITGLSRPTIWRHHSNGLIPRGIKIGRSVRWRLRAIEKWLDDGCPAVGGVDPSTESNSIQQ
jgi:predicted DNA-binding transcriptional regulator AlpA